MVLHARFVAAFRRLLGSWERYQDAPRHPERVAELGAARAELEVARSATAAAREEHHPDWQHPDARAPRPTKTSASSEDIARLRLQGGSFGHRGSRTLRKGPIVSA